MKFPRKRRALDSRIQQITGSSSSLAVICLMVLAGFTVARGDLLIVDMIPTLTGNNYPEGIVCHSFGHQSLLLLIWSNRFSNWNNVDMEERLVKNTVGENEIRVSPSLLRGEKFKSGADLPLALYIHIQTDERTHGY